jgi:hypothetical protein
MEVFENLINKEEVKFKEIHIIFNKGDLLKKKIEKLEDYQVLKNLGISKYKLIIII